MALEDGRRSILVVDDDAVFRKRMVAGLMDRGFEVLGVGSCEEALVTAEKESPELAVVDLRMPGASGLEAVRGLKAIDSATQVVVLTGYGSIATAVEAIRLGATHYLTKPVDLDQILAAFGRGAQPADNECTLGAEVTVPSLARVEWEHIHRVLQDCGGNISQAARLLGLHRRSLQRKLSKYPVQR